MSIGTLDNIEHYMGLAVAYMMLFLAAAIVYVISTRFRKWAEDKINGTVASTINVVFLVLVIVLGYPAVISIINYILRIVVI